MGEDPDQLRAAIDDTRRRMDRTVVALGERLDVRSRARERVEEIRGRVAGMDWRRWLPVAAGAAAVVGGAVAAVMVVRRRGGRPPERLSVPARRLPKPAQEVVLPAARRADRMLAQTAGEIGERRQRAVQAMSREIARALAEEQGRRNPLWLRVVRDAGTAAATTAATLTVRRLLSTPAQPPLREADATPGEPSAAVPMERALPS
jgi:Protein of unknown function (DUF3618)